MPRTPHARMGGKERGEGMRGWRKEERKPARALRPEPALGGHEVVTQPAPSIVCGNWCMGCVTVSIYPGLIACQDPTSEFTPMVFVPVLRRRAHLLP